MPPQDSTYDPPVYASASQIVSNKWSNTNGYTTPPVEAWNGQNQNGSTTATSPTIYSSSLNEPSTGNQLNGTRTITNAISINTSNLPIINNSTIINTDAGKILCVADVRGNISLLNKLADETGAKYVIHTGDFGFFETSSLERITEKVLRYVIQYGNLVPPQLKNRALDEQTTPADLRRIVLESKEPLISELPLFLEGKYRLNVPVYTVWGACEDVNVVENFRLEKYTIPNLFILDEASSYLIDVGNVNLRLFGLGGAIVHHKLFDNGEGSHTIAGGSGIMWTTALQIGELVDTAQKVYHPTETRVLVTHASPGREGLLAQLSLAIRADFTISAGLHFRYAVSYNDFAVQNDQESFRIKLENSRKNFFEMWKTVRKEVEESVDVPQKILLDNALMVFKRSPPPDKEYPGFKNMWNFNLPDCAFGHILLNISNGRMGAETKSQGFNFAYRRSNAQEDGIGGNSINQTPLSPSSISRRQLSQWQSSPSPALIPQNTQNRPVSPANMIPRDDISIGRKQIDRLHLDSHDGTSLRTTTPIPNDFAERSDPSKTNSTISIKSNNSSVNNNNNNNNTTTHNNDNDTSNSKNDNNSNNISSQNFNWAEADQGTNEAWMNKTEASAYNNLNGNRSESPQTGNSNQNGDDETSSSSLTPQSNQNQNQNRRNVRSQYSQYSVHVGQLNNHPVTEADLREFFSSIESGIDKVRLMYDRENPGVQRNFAYVDFVDDASLQKALQLNGQSLGGNNPVITKAEDRNYYDRNRGGRGRSRGGYRSRGNFRQQHGHNSHNRGGGNMQNNGGHDFLTLSP
ncbi:hypothetical protein G9A89_011506 [Geosiphon pyriformis]|nr:hypothetical protein G9A89_011506 [Geosiphon pyriformis]